VAKQKILLVEDDAIEAMDIKRTLMRFLALLHVVKKLWKRQGKQYLILF
jgi:hypothetical protein